MQPNIGKTKTLKICQNRGKKRLWIEGQYLSDAGFPHGTEYLIFHDPVEAQIIICSPEHWQEHRYNYAFLVGDQKGRKVAGTEKRPIIDCMGQKILEHFEPGQVIKLSCNPGFFINIRKEADNG